MDVYDTSMTRQMRKTEREVKDFDEKISILDRCEVIRVGLIDDPYPYVVPLSYGYEVVDGKVSLFFHCAPVGRKVELIEKNPHVCVECDMSKLFRGEERGISCDFESLICDGTVTEVHSEEALKGLRLIMEHCGYGNRKITEAMLERLKVYRIDLVDISGKRRAEDQHH